MEATTINIHTRLGTARITAIAPLRKEERSGLNVVLLADSAAIKNDNIVEIIKPATPKHMLTNNCSMLLEACSHQKT